MTKADWAQTIIVVGIALLFLGIGLWAGQLPLTYLRMDNLKCEFVFPPLTIEGVKEDGKP